MERRDRLVEQIEECEDRLLRIFARDRSHPLLSTDLTMQQLKALMILSFEGSASGHDLADGLGVGLATVTGIVDRLIARGLVERNEDPQDRRVRRVALTNEGAELLQRLRNAGREHRRRLLYRLDTETLGKLVDAMDALRVAAETECPEQPEIQEQPSGTPPARSLGSKARAGTTAPEAVMTRQATYRAEAIGSLLRPPDVKEAMRKAAEGELSRDELTRVQEKAIQRAIALQAECGLDVITDGEYRRFIFWDPIIASLDGLSVRTASPVGFGGKGSHDDVQLPSVTGKVSVRDSLLRREMRYLLDHTDRPTKATLPAMCQASALWLPEVSEPAYPTRNDYVADLVEVMRGEIAALVDMGVRYIQIDSPRYTYACSDDGRERLRALGVEDIEAWLEDMIGFDNRLVEGFDGVSFGLHLCRGNHRGMWSVEGGYDPIAERLFNEIRVDRLLLEYDSPRSGAFDPLRLVPEDKVVVLGLISTKEPEVESRDAILKRIEEASRFVPIDRLALSPQCGFASTLPGNPLTDDAQRRKLELVSSVAGEVWR